MPSPLGHALGGWAAGWLVAGPAPAEDNDSPRHRRPWLRRVPPRTLAFAGFGMAADLDLFLGRHSQFTHSIGMAMLIALGAYVALRLAQRATSGAPPNLASSAPGARTPAAAGAPFMRLAAATAAAYASHVLLDWLAQDATPPWGITALWPFSSSYYLSGLDVFRGISRQLWLPGALRHDVLAILREVVLLGPLALGAWWLRRRAPGQILPAAVRGDVQKLPPRSRLPARGESR